MNHFSYLSVSYYWLMIPKSFQPEGRNGWGQTLGKSCKIANSIVEHYLHNVVNDVNLSIPAKVYKTFNHMPSLSTALENSDVI